MCSKRHSNTPLHLAQTLLTRAGRAGIHVPTSHRPARTYALPGPGTPLDVLCLTTATTHVEDAYMTWTRGLTAVLSVAIAVGCNRQPPIDKVPIGSDVQLTRKDGALVEGKLTDRDPANVEVSAGKATKSVPREEVADLRIKDERTPEPPKQAKFREVTVPDDAQISVRLETPVDTRTTAAETPLRGELNAPVVVDGVTAIPAGAEVRGIVQSVAPAGKVKGRASIALVFDKLVADDKTYRLNARFERTAASTTTEDAKKIGLPAAGGAIVGAIIGGKKGAAIGAAAGGGAGTAVVVSTPGREVELPAGTVLSLAIGRAVDVRVPIR